MNQVSVRIVEDFGLGWRFLRADVPGAAKPEFDDSGWDTVVVPHCFNAADTFDATRGYYRGPAWYRKRFPTEERFRGKRVHLVCDGSFAVTCAYVNGTNVGEYYDGFTGFCADITRHLSETGENCIAIRVDNTHNPDVLPGREVPDYNLYGGIYREVYLVVTNDVHFPYRPVFVKTPDIDRGSGRVEMEVTVENAAGGSRRCVVRAQINDPNGRPVASAEADCSIPTDDVTTLTLEATVESPLLWSPDRPNLYELSLVVYEDGIPKDDIRVQFGFRWFRFDVDEGFFLNGKHLKLKGVNRHQCYPGLGNAVPKPLQIKDAELIKDIGGNFVRLSHYPQHPAFLDACDRLGILVYEEIASWQYIGGRRFGENAVAMMESMIRRDRNHPSVILWGLLNEGRSASLFHTLNETAHRQDSTRLTVYAENKPDRGKQLGTTSIPDVLGINYKLPHVDGIRALLPDAKLFSSEHTNADATVRGNFELEMKQAERISSDLDIIEAHGYMAGSALWSMHDYGTDYEPVWPVQHSGILDIYRIPKEAYYCMKSRWTTSPFVHIAGHWTWTGDEGKNKTVTVWSNCDEVELFLNDRSLGARQGKRVLEWSVPFEPGVLKAVGRAAAGPASDTLTTTEPPTRLELSGEPTVLAADGFSVSVITARIVDENGNTVPSAGHVITFAVQGNATIRGIGGKSQSTAAAGLARIIAQSGLAPDDITVTGTAAGLEPGVLQLRTTRD